MSDPLAFILAVHNHQPVGNFASVFERAFEDCYRPFLRELRKHPAVKFTAHYSGPLLEYMKDKEGECWEGLKEMVGRGQVELLGGGFYEPILSVIPEEDRAGQLAMMSDFLEAHFRTRPRGIWLTERVWEPALPRTLARAGIEYTLLDEEHFHYAGVGDLHSYYITEDQGYPLRLFPIDKKLRYLIPFHTLADIEGYLGEIASKNGLAVLGDDGEKFGLWPGTNAWVYRDGWLVRFLDFLETKDFRTRTYSEVLESRPPAGRVYLPPASYEEMMEWVLEPGAAAAFKDLKAANPAGARRYLRGGFFREFFLKYPESNLMNKRMVLVSRQVNAAGSDGAKADLYRGQCNDASWHGVFGGIYFPHLREAVYAHLLKAEATTTVPAGWLRLDYDTDGRDEAISRNPAFGAIVKPDYGGSLIEIDHYPTSRNLTDVLSRRRESYHIRTSQGSGQGKSIHELLKNLPPDAERLFRYDRHPRFSAMDRFLTRDASAERLEYGEESDRDGFLGRPYACAAEGNILRLSRDGEAETGGEVVPIRIRKEIETNGSGLIVRYGIKNVCGRPAELRFASEWNFYQTPEEISVGPSAVALCGGRLLFEVRPKAELWTFPLRTLSQSEEGYDIIHQGFCVLPSWCFGLAGEEEFMIEIRLTDREARTSP